MLSLLRPQLLEVRPTTEPVVGKAGLTLSIKIDRIDDNGFINLSVSPKISSPSTGLLLLLLLVYQTLQPYYLKEL